MGTFTGAGWRIVGWREEAGRPRTAGVGRACRIGGQAQEESRRRTTWKNLEPAGCHLCFGGRAHADDLYDLLVPVLCPGDGRRVLAAAAGALAAGLAGGRLHR